MEMWQHCDLVHHLAAFLADGRALAATCRHLWACVRYWRVRVTMRGTRPPTGPPWRPRPRPQDVPRLLRVLPQVRHLSIAHDEPLTALVWSLAVACPRLESLQVTLDDRGLESEFFGRCVADPGWVGGTRPSPSPGCRPC